MSLPKYLLLSSILISSRWAQFYRIQSFAGGGVPFDENALTAHLAVPTKPVIDQRGGLYVALPSYGIVVRVEAG